MTKVCSICKKKIGLLTPYYDEDEGLFCEECFKKIKGKSKKEIEIEKKKIVLKETEEEKKKAEESMNRSGYFKGNMCPFTIASIGGTEAAFGGSTLEHYEWKHLECIGEYCRLWDDKAKECSFKVMAESLKKK